MRAFLVRRELRQRTAAEEALRRSNEEIERQVDERTRDLVTANAKLEGRERRLRLVADFGVVHLFTTNNRGGVNYMSAGFCVTTGLDPSQVLGMGWTAAIHPDDRDGVLGAVAAVALERLGVRDGLPSADGARACTAVSRCA